MSILITKKFDWFETLMIGETCLDSILYQHQLKSLNKDLTCFKNVRNPGCIHFILTNSPGSFFKTETLFTRQSDFHKLVISILKKNTFSKFRPKKIIYSILRNSVVLMKN